MLYPVLRDDPDICMKCGFCMSGCPVYDIDKSESHTARGRHVLIRMAENNEIDTEDSYKSALYYCLLCGRCETVCPARIATNTITLNARKNLTEKKGLPLLQRLIFRGLLKHRSLFAGFAWLLSSIPGLTVKENKPIRHFPDIISAFVRGISAPRFSVPFLSRRVKKSMTGRESENEKKEGSIAFFAGCIFEFFFAGAGMDIIALMTDAGHKVVYPDQTCCALPVYASGDFKTAKAMAKSNIDSLTGYDYILTGCASCGSTLKSYVNWFDDEETKQKAYDISQKVRDVSEFLIQQDFKPDLPAGKPIKVTYHDPCHHKWKQGISAEPRALLKSIPWIEYIEMEDADACCGLGGSFRIYNPEVSKEIQTKKIESIRNTGADVVATSCPGCMIQLIDGIRREKLPVKVMHISQLVRQKQDQT